MAEQATKPDQPNDPEARWPAGLSMFAAAGLYATLPEYLGFGPRWLLPSIAVALTAVAALTHWRGLRAITIVIGHVSSAVLTASLLWSVGWLVTGLPGHRVEPVVLLRTAGALWAINVLVFALWYWRLDAGGPHVRDARSGHETGAFLFPQMTLDGPAGDEPDGREWSPKFMDYLFLAFNTSTAFSPTDVPVLSRWAKGLSMVQAVISLSVVVVLVGRGVNIL